MTREQPEANAIKTYFERRSSEVVSFAKELVERESPSGDAEGSREVVSLLEGSARGVDSVSSVERIEAQSGYGEHIRIKAFAKEPSDGNVLIIGHTDTVHPRGSLRARPVREEDGRVYGPGIFDMKANCALALELLRCCEELKWSPSQPLTLLFTCDEETGSAFGGRELVEEEARKASYVLVLEPPARGGAVKTARKGTGFYELSIEGRASHAGLEPEKGVSAILELARQIERLHGWNDAASGTTINVGVVEGGTHSNVVAERARAEIDVRFSSLSEAERIDSLMRGLMPFDERAKLRVEGGLNRPPMERTNGVLSLYEKARGFASLLGFKLDEASVGGASDGNFAAAFCSNVLDGLGVEGDGAHAVHEHIEAAGVARRGALIGMLLASL